MAAPNANYSELITTTLEKMRGKIADAITNNNAILWMLEQYGMQDSESGGRTILCPIDYAETGGFTFYRGYDEFAVQPTEVTTAAEYDWTQWACPVTISGLELMQNNDREARLKIIQRRTKSRLATLANRMAEAIRSDGTGFGGKQIHGTRHLISDVATGVVGGIDAAAYPDFWAPKITSFGVGTTTAGNIYARMLSMYQGLKRGKDGTKLIIADDPFYELYLNSLRPDQRFTDPKMATAGFDNVKFNQAAVHSDGGIGSTPQAGMTFINPQTIKMIWHSKRRNVVLPGPERTLMQDSATTVIVGMGQAVTDHRRLNGRFFEA